MEQILAQIAQLLDQARQGIAQLQAQAGQPHQQQGFGGTPQQGFGGGTPQQGGAMFGGTPQNTGQPSVTPEMIQTLIMPLVQNDRIKAALTQQMQEMGITELPQAQAHQLAELYQRFQNVKQQAEAAGLLGGNTGAGAPSLI